MHVIRVVRPLGAQVVSETVTSGELRETLMGLSSKLKEGSPAAEKGVTGDPISQP